jgi:hypothetical protein
MTQSAPREPTDREWDTFAFHLVQLAFSALQSGAASAELSQAGAAKPPDPAPESGKTRRRRRPSAAPPRPASR